MTYVLDASIAASLILPDEDPGAMTGLLEGLANEDRIRVPPLWWYEMTNLLSGAVRKKRLEEGMAFHALEALRKLDPGVDPRPVEEVAASMFLLARRHGLSSYDAAYLELAEREAAILCSHDGALRAAAQEAGIGVLPQG